MNRLFNRICDHEKLRARGLDPVLESSKKKIGTFEEGFHPTTKLSHSLKSKPVVSSDPNDEDVAAEIEDEHEDEDEIESVHDSDEENPELMAELAELTLPVFESMPSEEDIAAARQLPPVCIDDVQDLFENNSSSDVMTSSSSTTTTTAAAHRSKTENKKSTNNTNLKKEMQFAKESIKHRQTLLFSATAIQAQTDAYNRGKGNKKDTSNKKRKRDDAGVELPTHIEQ